MVLDERPESEARNSESAIRNHRQCPPIWYRCQEGLYEQDSINSEIKGSNDQLSVQEVHTEEESLQSNRGLLKSRIFKN